VSADRESWTTKRFVGTECECRSNLFFAPWSPRGSTNSSLADQTYSSETLADQTILSETLAAQEIFALS
jgi:hypothetical protein